MRPGWPGQALDTPARPLGSLSWVAELHGCVPSLRTCEYGQCLQERRRLLRGPWTPAGPSPSPDLAGTLIITGSASVRRAAGLPASANPGQPLQGSDRHDRPGLDPLPLLKSRGPHGRGWRSAPGQCAPRASWSPGVSGGLAGLRSAPCWTSRSLPGVSGPQGSPVCLWGWSE